MKGEYRKKQKQILLFLRLPQRLACTVYLSVQQRVKGNVLAESTCERCALILVTCTVFEMPVYNLVL